MVTVPQEQVVQRNHHVAVSVQHSNADDAPSEVLWASTTEGLTVTDDKTVAANQKVRQDIYDRLNTAAGFQGVYPETNLADLGISEEYPGDAEDEEG